jgi:hypothetical protein
MVDLRNDYDEKAEVNDGTLYRKGRVVQVWWIKDTFGRPFKGNKGRETWTTPDLKNARYNFDEMRSRW